MTEYNFVEAIADETGESEELIREIADESIASGMDFDLFLKCVAAGSEFTSVDLGSYDYDMSRRQYEQEQRNQAFASTPFVSILDDTTNADPAVIQRIGADACLEGASFDDTLARIAEATDDYFIYPGPEDLAEARRSFDLLRTTVEGMAPGRYLNVLARYGHSDIQAEAHSAMNDGVDFDGFAGQRGLDVLTMDSSDRVHARASYEWERHNLERLSRITLARIAKIDNYINPDPDQEHSPSLLTLDLLENARPDHRDILDIAAGSNMYSLMIRASAAAIQHEVSFDAFVKGLDDYLRDRGEFLITLPEYAYDIAEAEYNEASISHARANEIHRMLESSEPPDYRSVLHAAAGEGNEDVVDRVCRIGIDRDLILPHLTQALDHLLRERGAFLARVPSEAYYDAQDQYDRERNVHHGRDEGQDARTGFSR